MLNPASFSMSSLFCPGKNERNERALFQEADLPHRCLGPDDVQGADFKMTSEELHRERVPLTTVAPAPS